MTDLSSHQNAIPFSGGNGRGASQSNGNGYHQPSIVGNDRDKLTGKVALIIGPLTVEAQELAYALAYHGADIALIYRPEDHLPAHHTSEKIRGVGKRCLLIPVPARQRVPRHIIRRVIDHFGHLDIFIDRSTASRREGYENHALFPTLHLMTAAMNQIVRHSSF